MNLCQAYREARSIDDPLPGWVLEWLDRGFEAFWDAFVNHNADTRRGRRGNSDEANAFAKAFGIQSNTRGRGQSTWGKYLGPKERLLGFRALQVAMKWAAEGKPVKESAIVAAAADRHNEEQPHDRVSPETARREWVRFKRDAKQHSEFLEPYFIIDSAGRLKKSPHFMS